MAASDEDIVNTSSFVKDCIHQLFTIQGRSTAGLGESVPLKTSKDSVALIHRFISESGEAIKTNLSEIKIGGQPGLFPGLCRMTTTEEDAVWQMRIYVNAAIESGSPAAALLSTLAATHMFICNAIARDCVRVVPGLLRGAAIALAESKLVELAKQQGGWVRVCVSCVCALTSFDTRRLLCYPKMQSRRVLQHVGSMFR